MKFLLPKDVKYLLLSLAFSIFVACKKEIIEVNVDAFAQLNAEVKLDQSAYNILFTLQKYPYREVGLRLSKSKDSFYSGLNLTTYIANEVSNARYGVFVNSLTANQTYYYQIYVKDSNTNSEVYSDVFSFKTNP